MKSEHHSSERMPVVQLAMVGSPLSRSQGLERLRILVDDHGDGRMFDDPAVGLQRDQ
jgi:hypothetical protein